MTTLVQKAAVTGKLTLEMDMTYYIYRYLVVVNDPTHSIIASSFSTPDY
jgi:hypothetical protein